MPRKNMKKRGGSTLGSLGQGQNMLKAQANHLKARSKAAPHSGGGSEMWALMAHGPINGANVTYTKEFTNEPVPSMGELIDNSMVRANQYNDPMGGVAPMDSDVLGRMSRGGAKKKRKASKKPKRKASKKPKRKASKKPKRKSKKGYLEETLKMVTPTNLADIVATFTLMDSKSKKRKASKKKSSKKRVVKRKAASKKRKVSKKKASKKRVVKRKAASKKRKVSKKKKTVKRKAASKKRKVSKKRKPSKRKTASKKRRKK